MGNAIQSLLRQWMIDFSIRDSIVFESVDEPRSADVVPIPDEIPGILQQILIAEGIVALYSHQADAWASVRAGRNTVILTGTSSGKTLCYNLPVFTTLLEEIQSRALYIFPTKALAQDQLKVLNGWTNQFPERLAFPIGIYDGDTPQQARSEIRRNARVVLTNPDMLHMGILPHHTLWMKFFQSLRYVVIDEMHVYRGVFGSHFANLMRRLIRLAQFYGSKPVFILTSATISNPEELASRLIGQSIHAIAHDGSPHGRKHFILYNPPVINKRLGLRAPLLTESARLVNDLMRAKLQTLQFVVTRRSVELMLKHLGGGGGTSRIQGYRSGYLPFERRAIEKGLREHELDVVISTNALELGIDIGGIDAALISGYPGSIASTRQQIGRAGRRSADSLAVLVASQDPIDQYLTTHPEYLTDSSPEKALIDPDNLVILMQHLRCALFELPFPANPTFGTLDRNLLNQLLDFLTSSGEVHEKNNQRFWMAEKYPAGDISLRSSSPSTIVLRSTDSNDLSATIGIVDYESACWMVHPQAIYMHAGTTYLVESLDLENNLAELKPYESDYYTQPQSKTTIELITLTMQEQRPHSMRTWGELRVTTQVVGFKKMRWFTNENLGQDDLDLPPSVLNTQGYWLVIPEHVVRSIRDLNLWGNDPGDYGPQWPRIRSLVLERDQHRCQVCGTPSSLQPLHVHHIRPLRTFDSIQDANRLDNLTTLCPTCHQNVEANQYIRSGLTGLGYVFHHLATLFLMCDVDDIGVQTESASALADGQPAVVLYDRAPGGIGLSKALYDMDVTVLIAAQNLVESCPCQDGCPSCVGPGGENGAGAKELTQAILRELIKDK